MFGKLWAPTPSFYAAINLIIKVCGNMRNVLYELLSGRNPHLSTKLCTRYNFNEGKRWTKVGRRYIKNANNFARVGIFSALIIALIFLNWGISSQGCRVHISLFSKHSPFFDWSLCPWVSWVPSSLGLGSAGSSETRVSSPWLCSARPATYQENPAPLHSQWL